jgi:hypothetical protein
MVSKYHDRLHRGGRQKHWIKIKNPDHPSKRPTNASATWRGRLILRALKQGG